MHDDTLRHALHAEVAHVHPQPAIDDVLAAPHAHSWLWLWALIGTIGALLLAIGLWMAAQHSEPQPTDTTTHHLLEA